MADIWRSVTDRLDLWYIPMVLFYIVAANLRWRSRRASNEHGGADRAADDLTPIFGRPAHRGGIGGDALLVLFTLALLVYPFVSPTFCQNVRCRGKPEPRPSSTTDLHPSRPSWNELH